MMLLSRRIAKSQPDFLAWMLSANVGLAITPPEEVKAHFDTLYELKEVPNGLTEVSIFVRVSFIRNFWIGFLPYTNPRRRY